MDSQKTKAMVRPQNIHATVCFPKLSVLPLQALCGAATVTQDSAQIDGPVQIPMDMHETQDVVRPQDVHPTVCVPELCVLPVQALCGAATLTELC